MHAPHGDLPALTPKFGSCCLLHTRTSAAVALLRASSTPSSLACRVVFSSRSSAPSLSSWDKRTCTHAPEACTR